MKYIKTILVIDDNEETSAELAEIYKSLNYTVGLASDGESAIDALQERDVDLVIMDLLLPDISAVTLINRLKAASPDVEIIVMTNFQNSEILSEALLSGASLFVQKPIISNQIIALSLKCLERRWMRQENSRLMFELAFTREKLEEHSRRHSNI